MMLLSVLLSFDSVQQTYSLADDYESLSEILELDEIDSEPACSNCSHTLETRQIESLIMF